MTIKPGQTLLHYRLIDKIGEGGVDEAFSWPDLAFTNRDGWLVGLNVEPEFDPLRSAPRYQQLLRRMGLAGRSP